MCDCCTPIKLASMKKNFNVKTEHTDKGIKVNIEPKDSSKVEAFKKFIDASQDLCGEDCCSG